MATLKIVTLGHTHVTLDGQEIFWYAASARDLLFYLLSFPDGRSQRDVALALWPDEDNENAASSNRFRVALHRLRAALGSTETVVKEYERYRLSPEVLAASDVIAMQSALYDAQLAGTASRPRATAKSKVTLHLISHQSGAAANLYHSSA